jgi:hypothetical protein
MILLARLVSAVRHVLKIVFQVPAEHRLNRSNQLRLVVFHRKHEVALLGDDLPGDFLLAPHCVDRDDRAFHIDLLDQLWNGRDFV